MGWSLPETRERNEPSLFLDCTLSEPDRLWGQAERSHSGTRSLTRLREVTYENRISAEDLCSRREGDS